jgi:hypothetical protein
MKKILEEIVYQLRKNPRQWERWKMRFYRLFSGVMTILYVYITEGILDWNILTQEFQAFVLEAVAIILGIDIAWNVIGHESVKAFEVLKKFAKRDKETGEVLNPQTDKPFEDIPTDSTVDSANEPPSPFQDPMKK